MFHWPTDTVIPTPEVGNLLQIGTRGEVFQNKIASLPLLSQLYTHPSVSVGLPSLLLQARRRSLVSHIPLFHIRCPQCCSYRIRKGEQNARNRYQFQQNSCNTEATTYRQYMSRAPNAPAPILRIDDLPSVCCFILLNVLLPLRTIPLLQLKVSRMSRWAGAFPLQDHKHDRPNHWYKIQRQVHEVPNNRRRCEFLKRLLRQLPQLAHDIAASLDLSSLADEICSVLGYQHAIECVDKGVFN